MPLRHLLHDRGPRDSDLNAIFEAYVSGFHGSECYSTIDELRNRLEVSEQEAIEIFDIMSIFANVTRITGKVPLQADNNRIKWVSYNEAEELMKAEDYFARQSKKRLPEDIRNKEFKGELRDDIKAKISRVLGKNG